MNYFPVPAVNTPEWTLWRRKDWTGRSVREPSISLCERIEPESLAGRVLSLLNERAPEFVSVEELYQAAYANCRRKPPADINDAIYARVKTLRQSGHVVSHNYGLGYRIGGDEPTSKDDLRTAEGRLLAVLKAAGPDSVPFDKIAPGKSRANSRSLVKKLRELVRRTGEGSVESVKAVQPFVDRTGRHCTRQFVVALRLIEAGQ